MLQNSFVSSELSCFPLVAQPPESIIQEGSPIRGKLLLLAPRYAFVEVVHSLNSSGCCGTSSPMGGLLPD